MSRNLLQGDFDCAFINFLFIKLNNLDESVLGILCRKVRESVELISTHDDVERDFLATDWDVLQEHVAQFRRHVVLEV